MSDERMTEGQPIGPVLDELGVTTSLRPSQRITEAIVLAKVIDMESGAVALGVWHSDVDWVTQMGLLEAARDAIRSGAYEADDDD